MSVQGNVHDGLLLPVVANEDDVPTSHEVVVRVEDANAVWTLNSWVAAVSVDLGHVGGAYEADLIDCNAGSNVALDLQEKGTTSM